MERRQLGMGLVMGLIPIFIALLNLFEPDKMAQSLAALGYVVAVSGIMWWATRRVA
jgi:site-specific recombinase